MQPWLQGCRSHPVYRVPPYGEQGDNDAQGDDGEVGVKPQRDHTLEEQGDSEVEAEVVRGEWESVPVGYGHLVKEEDLNP